jgi:hypothetical protein
MIAHMTFSLLNAVCFSAAYVWLYSMIRRDRNRPGILVPKILEGEILAAMSLGILVQAMAKNATEGETGIRQICNFPQGRNA